MKPRVVLVAITIAGLAAGCQQPTDTRVTNVPEQDVTTPVQQQQETGTQGSTIIYNLYFGAEPGAGVPAGIAGLADALPYKSVTGDPAKPASDTNTGWSFQNNSFAFHNTTGGTTPTVTGTATGTGAGTQTASPAQTVSPRQDVRPEFTSSVPIGTAMPGGMVDLQATAAGSGGTTGDTGKTSTNRIDWMQVITEGVKQLGPETVQSILDTILGRKQPASQPSQ